MMDSDWEIVFDELANATATFERREVTGTFTDRYGEEQNEHDWVVIHENIPIRYEDRETREGALQAFAPDRFGIEIRRAPILIAPGYIAEDIIGGERVKIKRGNIERVKRVVSPDYDTLDFGDEGMVTMHLENFGDSDG